VDYIAKVLGAISELGLEDEFQSEVPSIQEVSFQTYANFAKDVLNYCTRLEIRYGRRIQGFSVAFDAKTKSKVHHHIGRIREIFTALDVEERKREALLGRLGALEQEVDRNRTRLEAFGELVIEVASVAGVAAEKLNPVKEMIDSISRLIWGSRQNEPKQIPPPKDRKKIESRPRHPTRDIDDEVPF
jgi:hypothetical protein